jgi:hypothetical protein
MAKGEKASLVQCRIEAKQKIDEIAETKEVNKREAMRMLAGDTGVPFETLKYWYYRDDESRGGEVPPPQPSKKTAKSKAKIAARIVSNIAKSQKKEADEAMAQANRDGAKALADELGGAILAEELYELFLKNVSKIDEIIAANKELADPMEPSKVIDQLLRMARNIGWIEGVVAHLNPVIEPEEVEVESNTCNKCVVISCPNRMCENHKPKKRKVTKVPQGPKPKKGKKDK